MDHNSRLKVGRGEKWVKDVGFICASNSEARAVQEAVLSSSGYVVRV